MHQGTAGTEILLTEEPDAWPLASTTYQSRKHEGPVEGNTIWGTEMRPLTLIARPWGTVACEIRGCIGAGPGMPSAAEGIAPRRLSATRIWKSLADLKAHTGCASWCRFLIKMY